MSPPGRLAIGCRHDHLGPRAARSRVDDDRLTICSDRNRATLVTRFPFDTTARSDHVDGLGRDRLLDDAAVSTSPRLPEIVAEHVADHLDRPTVLVDSHRQVQPLVIRAPGQGFLEVAVSPRP